MAFRKPALDGAEVCHSFYLVSHPRPIMPIPSTSYGGPTMRARAQRTTILQCADRRPQVTLNNTALTAARMQQMSTFVEQEDALLGVLTVRETVTYALRLQ
jgi:hypothetical protein